MLSRNYPRPGIPYITVCILYRNGNDKKSLFLCDTQHAMRMYTVRKTWMYKGRGAGGSSLYCAMNGKLPMDFLFLSVSLNIKTFYLLLKKIFMNACLLLLFVPQTSLTRLLGQLSSLTSFSSALLGFEEALSLIHSCTHTQSTPCTQIHRTQNNLIFYGVHPARHDGPTSGISGSCVYFAMF